MIDQSSLEAVVVLEWSSQTDGSHDIGHLRRVWKNCLWIAAKEDLVDMDVLRVAAFLHDVVNLPKDSPNRAKASHLSAAFAVSYLEKTGFEKDKLSAVFHAIEAHSFSANIATKTREAEILQDADRIDALGAVGIARMMYISGSLQRSLFDANDPWAKNRELDDTRFALDHFETKIFGLEKTMKTDAGRRLAKERTLVMRAFCEQLRLELP